MKTPFHTKGQYERSGFDRRSGRDRRVAIDLDYLDMLGRERRRVERRKQGEKRKGWIRYSEWTSVYAGIDYSSITKIT